VAPEFSVIVPVRDGANSLPSLLQSLERQTLSASRFEVIVVDNGSRDDTADVARRLGATVVHELVPSRSLARNAGARRAAAERLAFVDADCVTEPGWLEGFSRCGTAAPLLAGAVRTTTSPAPNPIERYEVLWRFDQESWVKLGWAATANLCVARDALQAVGGFDPHYLYGEDADFCIRARRAGYDLGFCGEALVTHAAERRLAPFLRRSWRHGYSGNQVFHRIGAGYVAWRNPWPMFSGSRALQLYEIGRDSMPRGEWQRMAALAQISYLARVTGSLYSSLRGSR
jgi:glycosyltransferase involved in cell wall biosynthesis